MIASRASTLLREIHRAAVAAVQPDAAVRAALDGSTPADAPQWIIALGKASSGMAAAIVAWLATHGREPAGGIVVTPDALAATSHPLLQVIAGDHPLPGDRSRRAADSIGETVDRIPHDAVVHLAISGGSTSLVAGPLPGLSMEDVVRTFELLLTAGLDIHEMNAIRKRVTRWSAGRLALALRGRAIHVWIVSDVPGDDLSSIASGPCTGDPWTREQVRSLVTRHALDKLLPPSVRRALEVETPKPGDPALHHIVPRIVASNRVAVDAAVREAARRGFAASAAPERLTGDAAGAGRAIARFMLGAGDDCVRVWGGETTVTIAGEHGTGGRSQELALAASHELRGSAVTLLAAGTDGRDGPTDAAGAIVDGETWDRIAAAGRDPERDLARHDAYNALEAAGALITTGLTGTNVMDLVIAVSEAPRVAPS